MTERNPDEGAPMYDFDEIVDQEPSPSSPDVLDRVREQVERGDYYDPTAPSRVHDPDPEPEPETPAEPERTHVEATRPVVTDGGRRSLFDRLRSFVDPTYGAEGGG